MNIIAVIPARMASSRFPGKPLVNICGKTMIEHVWQRARLNKYVEAAYIATCDDEIRLAAEGFGADVIMTSDTHQRGTDRVAEGCSKLIAEGKDFDVTLNIQGDEPLLNPETIDLLVKPFLEGENVFCVNLIEALEGEAEVNSYNNVKVIFDQQNFALYFSRLPIPYGITSKHYKQLGMYAFTKETILKYPQMTQTPLEIAESDDMLRFVENRIPVKVVLSKHKTLCVDTPGDYERVSLIMKEDPLFRTYKDR